MSFVFPIILGGLITAGVPILLHLIMRQKPRTLQFPAFRFLVKRHKTNLRKLRLRHLLLLALRVLLLAAICLALARPKLFNTGFNLAGDRPVAAVLLFDTSYSMDYKTSDGPSRLDEARKRGLELLNELPGGSRVAILDTGESVTSRGEWLTSMHQAGERIKGLQLRAANAPLTLRLEDAFRMFADLAQSKEDDAAKDLPRLLCVFSDRTRGCWDQGRLPQLHDRADQVPAMLGGLQRLQDQIPALIDSLKELRQKIPPPPGKDYPEQALIDVVQQLRDRIPTLESQDLTGDRELSKLLENVRRPARQLLAALHEQSDKDQANQAKEYREKLLKELRGALDDLRGVHALFVDVGVDRPVDLAILDVELPRNSDGQMQQVFASDKRISLRVQVQATGKDYNSAVQCRIGKKTYENAVVLSAGEKQTYLFEIDCQELNLTPGQHQIEVRLTSSDLLAFNNSRFVTFAIREPRRVLVLAEEPAKAERFKSALESTSFKFTVEVKRADEAERLIGTRDLRDYQAVYLFCLARPEKLWGPLGEYVAKGGGLGIIPGGKESDPAAYNQEAAQKLMPARLKKIIDHRNLDKGASWNFDSDAIYQHPLLRPFRNWRDSGQVDVFVVPRKAVRYWEVEPDKTSAAVLVSYSDDKNRPALIERLHGKDKGRQGKVLLFTTTFDTKRQPPWNDYLDSTNSFYLVIASLATHYLAGDTEEPTLNFLSGQADPIIRLPLSPRFVTYSLQGPDVLEAIAVDDQQNELVLKQALAPGNYTLHGTTSDGGSRKVAAFSVNIPPEESNLTRVPVSEIETVLGSGAVLPMERRAAIKDILEGHWNQPVELFPFLMILLLLVLAVENLLSNKFYKKEPEDGGSQ
jgi:hypothetical protein